MDQAIPYSRVPVVDRVRSQPMPASAKLGVGCVEIRPYRPEDAGAVREVHLKAFEGREKEAHLVDLLHSADAAPVSLVATEEPAGSSVTSCSRQ